MEWNESFAICPLSFTVITRKKIAIDKIFKRMAFASIRLFSHNNTSECFIALRRKWPASFVYAMNTICRNAKVELMKPHVFKWMFLTVWVCVERKPIFLSQLCCAVHVWLCNPFLRLVLTFQLTHCGNHFILCLCVSIFSSFFSFPLHPINLNNITWVAQIFHVYFLLK